MSVLSRFQTIDDADKHRAVHTLVERSTPDFDFFFMVTLSVLMAAAGLLLGSETIVIGSMLIAPLLYPVLGVALGLSLSDPIVLRRSLWTVAKSSLVALAAAAVAALFYAATHNGVGHETPIIASRTTPSLLSLLVGVIAGVAVAYAMVKPKLSETLPGIAISVALIPPLAASGIGFAWLDLTVALGALATFFINVLGIVGAGMMTFSLMNVYEQRSTAENALVHEEVRMEIENEKVKAADGELDKQTQAAQ